MPRRGAISRAIGPADKASENNPAMPMAYMGRRVCNSSQACQFLNIWKPARIPPAAKALPPETSPVPLSERLSRRCQAIPALIVPLCALALCPSGGSPPMASSAL
ncbi:hypothetical protein D9M69_445830 [compost metagenome]